MKTYRINTKALVTFYSQSDSIISDTVKNLVTDCVQHYFDAEDDGKSLSAARAQILIDLKLMKEVNVKEESINS